MGICYQKSKSSSKIFEMVEVMTENSEFLKDFNSKIQRKAIFLFDKEDQFRPEVQSYHEIVKKIQIKEKENS